MRMKGVALTGQRRLRQIKQFEHVQERIEKCRNDNVRKLDCAMRFYVK